MVAPEELSDSVTACPDCVWLYEPGTGQKAGVAAVGGGGGGNWFEDPPPPPPPQAVATSAKANTANQLRNFNRDEAN